MGRLYQHTQWTAACCAEVIEERTVDSFGLANLRSDLRHEEHIGKWDKGGQSTQQTTISNSFSVFARSVTVAEISYQASAAVVETTEQSMGPLSRHVESERQIRK